MATSEAFEKAYGTLNQAQKKAVDTVEGPVLVIAGPGTGKTHILTLRIANILKETQANPTNILVLTFTDSAARTVRERLRGLIGDQPAREVGIYTFHSFCDYVLKEWPDFFPDWRGKRPTGDVEATLLWREVLETADAAHLRPAKSPFLYLRDLETLAKDLARERVSLDAYRAWADEEAAAVRADEGNYYTRDSKYGKKGDFKPDGQKKLERLEKAHEAARLIEAYEVLKEARGVYDFSDVLRGVVDALEGDEALRTVLQEQYQYVLADEHQDANAYQHALLDAFAYDEHPNLFVVGDEKQAIFRFQGADSTQFREFLKKYPRTTLVELDTSFRSLQGILDAAHAHAGASIPASHGEHAKLGASRKGEAALALLAAPDPLAERDQVASLVEKAIEEGVPAEEIAVIAAKNASVDRFAEHLAARGIPTLRAGSVALSSRPAVRSLLALMRAVADPLDTASLRESLLAPWWNIGLPERAGFLARTRDRDLLAELSQHFPKVAEIVTGLQARAGSEAPLPLFSRVLAESGARAFLLSRGEELTEDVPLVRRLYGYLEELVARDHGATFPMGVEALTKAREHGLEWVKSAVLERAGAVTVITAHKAKGMEFSRVFVVGLTENEWERGGRAGAIPSPAGVVRDAEDAAKQFYVAVTRAKDALTFSYAEETLEGRSRNPSRFIPDGLPLAAVESDPLPVIHADVDAPQLVRALTKSYLMGEGLSPSALQDYLDSPATFFARRVLHLREPEQPATAIGSSVHSGIAAYLESADADKAYAALEACLHRSLLPRDARFEQLASDARQRLAAFLKEGGSFGAAVAVEKTYRTERAVAGETVRLSGKVDAVLEREGRSRIVDFKTSSTVRGKESTFELQLAFYDLLLRAEGMTPSGTCIVQVRTDGVEEFPVPVSDETRAQLEATLDAVIGEMLSGNWRPAGNPEPTDYDDLLALFA